jgi:hypothetical protein
MTQQQAIDRAGGMVSLMIRSDGNGPVGTLAVELLKFEGELLAREQQRWMAHDCPNRIDRLTMGHT